MSSDSGTNTTVNFPKSISLGYLSAIFNEPISRSDLLNSILTKDSYEDDDMHLFFCGSPPSRVDNPLIHDSKFGDDIILPFSPPQPKSPPRKGGGEGAGGCVKANFGNNPVKRIEGFDCLSKDADEKNCRIPTLA